MVKSKVIVNKSFGQKENSESSLTTENVIYSRKNIYVKYCKGNTKNRE